MNIKLTHRIVTSLAILCAGALLTACGEDDSRFEESIAAAQVADDGLAITGKPGTAAVQDNPYDFQPEVHNPDDKLLTFSITGKPEWATFKKRTGRLSGQPGQAEVGMEYSVQISVSDGVRTAKLRRFRIRVVAFGTEQVTLAW
ncbi:MAG TPA: Ig domain-containing protein, partial [Gammaproteobacteria bacterium]|nr:Ig domain-containing protein [Gammaproteobacteria bacterium]